MRVKENEEFDEKRGGKEDEEREEKTNTYQNAIPFRHSASPTPSLP